MPAPTFFEDYRALIDAALEGFLRDTSDEASRLYKAMRYSVVLGGKRVRPILTLATAKALKCSTEQSINAACSVEMIHAYSLIHDDLPAMDNDDLRRGQATCHIAYDEACAILAGDALQASAFEILCAEDFSLPDAAKLNLVKTLSQASGAQGMVLGQEIDLSAVGQTLNLNQLERMHAHKTGKLIEASVVMGAICGGASLQQQDALRTYSQALGLAFQVQDDILDVTGDTSTIGKSSGADNALNKPTYVSLLGIEGAQRKLANLHSECLSSLSELNTLDTHELEAIASYVVERKN